VCYPLWKYGEYPHQLGETIFAAAALVAGDTAWDIGANIGYRSLLVSHLVGVDGVVIAVEPSHRALRLLVRTASSLENVRVFDFAIAARDGVVSFAEHSQLDTSCVAEESAGTYQVEAVTLDALAQVTGTIPWFIKLDVEGTDAAVIRGRSPVIGENHPILQFEALDAENLQGCWAAIRGVGVGMYDVLRLNIDGTLGARTGIVPTDNYVALTSEHRQLEPLERLLR
jgi:FkbM family methyltransferase